MVDTQGTDLAIGIDVGGTKVAAVVVDRAGHRLEKARRPTPSADASQVEDVVVDLVDELRSRHDARTVGVAVAGLVDPQGVVMDAVHLAMDHHPFRSRLEERLHLPVTVENDGTAAAWAEYRFGKGAGADPLLVVTVGTGLGGGLVVGGKLIRGAFGTAGEIGHVVVERDGGRPCPCGDRGCLEQYASGRALVREAQRLMQEHPGAAHGLVERSGGDPDRLDGPAVTEAARAGDPAALRSFAAIGGALGRGLASVANVIDPERIVIGGGVAEAGDLLLTPLLEVFSQHMIGRAQRPLAEVVLARMGNDAGAAGAADLARHEWAH